MIRTFLRWLFGNTTPVLNSTPQLTIRERFTALGNIPRFFALVWKTHRGLTLAGIALRLLRAAIPALALFVGKLIIDELVLHLQHQPADISRLWSYILWEFVLALFADIFNRSIALCDSLLGDLVANSSSVALMRHAATLEMEMFENAVFYDKLEKARRQTTSRIALMSQTLAQLQDSITMIFLAIGLVYFSPWLILLLVITVIPGFIGEARFNARTYSLLNAWTPQRRELDYLRYTGASDETAKEIKIFGLSDFLANRYQTLSDEYYQENSVLSVKRAAWGTVFATIASVGYYGAYLVIIIQALRGALTLGEVTFLAGSFRALRDSFQTVLSRFASIAEAAVYLRDLFDFFDLRPTAPSPTNPRPFPRPIQQGFTFENVGYRYSQSDVWAVRHLSFTVQAGQKIALVGENGAGKTTIVKLLARLYEPHEGRILLDGHDLREYSLDELRAEIGVIFQDYVRYQMTAGTNIAVGKIEEQDNTEKIEYSAAQSLANSVVVTLPDGYHQMLGRRFGKGLDLSGGQWQKIALARAYMRDAQVIILDEPTAALDARAEHEIFQRFSELTSGKTAILISHRFSTVRMADSIIVLDKGQVIECGSHAELVAQGGRYAELFRLQAKGYL